MPFILHYRRWPVPGNPGIQLVPAPGNSGSCLNSFIISDDRKFYGFTQVGVYQSGKVLVKSYGRNLPAEGYLTDPSKYPTVLKNSLEVTWGK
jgi:hypothetical protein